MAKRKEQTTAEVAETLPLSQVVDLLMTVPEISEAYTRADIELALDDRGWLNTSYSPYQVELTSATRRSLVQRARLYWHRDPLAKQAVRLWTDYALGNGITYKAEDDATQGLLDSFCKHRLNRRVMNSEGQRRSSKKLLIDGEVFFAVFDGPKGQKYIRRIDPVQITDIITDPDDSERVLAYRREIAGNENAAAPNVTSGAPAATRYLYYADWTCDAAARKLAERQRAQNDPVRLEPGVVVYHVPFDALDKRGNGLLSSVVDWSREHRRFMEARVAITQALAKYANKLKVKGGQAVIDRLQQSLQSSMVRSGATSIERNPENAPAGTWIENAGLELSQIPRMTGAGDARMDGDQLKLMVSAGTGIMLHYFGDPSTGNLATATAMELPMLKMFESYQQLWLDAYRDLFSIVLGEDPDDEPAVIDIDMPPILSEDLQKLAQFLTAAKTAVPDVVETDEIAQRVLQAAGVNNIAEVMKKIAVLKKQRQANEAKQAAAVAKLAAGKASGQSADGEGDDPTALTTEAATRLAVALERVAEAIHP